MSAFFGISWTNYKLHRCGWKIDVRPNVPAKIIINERTGTIVATQNVRISPVAVSSSNVIFLSQLQVL